MAESPSSAGEPLEEVPGEESFFWDTNANRSPSLEFLSTMHGIMLSLLPLAFVAYALLGSSAALTEWRLAKLQWRILTPENCRRYLLANGWTEPARNEFFPKLKKADLQISFTCVITAPVSQVAILSAVDSSVNSRSQLVVFTLVAAHESLVAEMLSRQISVIHYKQMKNFEQILRSHAAIIETHKGDAKTLLTRALQSPLPAALLGHTPPPSATETCGRRDLLIAETELVQCFFRDHGSDKVIIAFSDSWHNGREGRLLPRIDLAALGYSVIDFVATVPCWFPAEDMMALVPAVLSHMAGFTQRITFGFSQGGYAALKFSAALCANVTIAFSPQFSIDPRVVKGDRFGHLFRSNRNIGMSLGTDDCTCPSYVFFDPFDKTDMRHVELIAREIGIHQVPMPFFGHGTVKLFATPDRLVQLLLASLEGDVVGLHRIARQWRHINQDRAYFLALHLTERKPSRALQIIEKHKAEWTHSKQADICYYLSLGSAINAALCWSGQLAIENPESHNVQGCAALVAMRAGDLGLASFHIKRALELNPGDTKWRWVKREIQTFKNKQIAAAVSEPLSFRGA